jgi:hypothetical protein
MEWMNAMRVICTFKKKCFKREIGESKCINVECLELVVPCCDLINVLLVFHSRAHESTPLQYM